MSVSLDTRIWKSKQGLKCQVALETNLLAHFYRLEVKERTDDNGASLICCIVPRENVRPGFESLLCQLLCVLEQVMIAA